MVDSDLKNHNLAFEIVKHHVEVDLPGVKVDVSGKDPNRGCFAGHDPNAFYKEESEAIEIPVADPEPQAASGHPSGSVCSGTRLSNYIDKYEQSNTFVAGNRHSYLVKLSSVLNNAGFSLYDAVSECVRRYGSADFPAAEVETTVNDIYRRYSASHGSCAFRPDGTSSVSKSAKSAKSATPFPKMAQKDVEYGECDDIELDNTLLPCFDENIYGHLPPLLTDILKCAYSRTDRDILLISSLTLLSSVSPGVKGSLGEHDYTPAFYSIITGGSGSGKGRIAALQRILNNLMQQGTQVEIESALLKIYPEQGTYSDYNTLPDSLYLYIADENNVVTDAVTDYLGSEVQRGTLSEDNTFNENTYYYFDVTQFMQEELGAFGMYKHNLQLVFNSDDYTGTFKNLTFNDQGGRNPVTLQLIYKVYESY